MTKKKKAKPKVKRGFAAMDPELRRKIARKGGKAAHKKGVAPEWTSETARAAGRKGGIASHGGRGRTTPTPAPEPGNMGEM